MEYIQRLPFILGSIAGLITAVICSKLGFANKDIYLRMLMSLGVFCVVGYVVKRTVLDIVDEQRVREVLRIRKEEDERRMMEYEAKKLAETNESGANQDKSKSGMMGRMIDFSAVDEAYKNKG